MANLVLGTFSIRELDGLYSLNDLHAASGGNANHRPGEFLRNEQTKALILEIENAGISAFRSAKGRNGGTYACRELVIAYAAWISPAFHLKVIRVFLAVTTPQPVAADSPSTNPVLDRLRQTRFLLYIDPEDRLQITPLDPDACVLSPSKLSSMQTLIREYVPHNVIAEILRAGIERLAHRAG